MAAYRCEVVKYDALKGVWVEVAALVPGFRFGPCEFVGGATPVVGQSALAVDVGDPADPDFIVIC